MILGARSRVCLENAFCKMCVTVCGKFIPDEGVVAGYDNRIWNKNPAKWGVQIAGMILGAHSRPVLFSGSINICKKTGSETCLFVYFT